MYIYIEKDVHVHTYTHIYIYIEKDLALSPLFKPGDKADLPSRAMRYRGYSREKKDLTPLAHTTGVTQN